MSEMDWLFCRRIGTMSRQLKMRTGSKARIRRLVRMTGHFPAAARRHAGLPRNAARWRGVESTL